MNQKAVREMEGRRGGQTPVWGSPEGSGTGNWAVVSKLRLACFLESMRWESEHLEGSRLTQTE